ncbi:hypothetical protein AB0C38_27465 [Amycolatopsis sp. NPDC048633]|uniref:hypothetical protein n=1 Tax=Amycolatopsis sp. NPDC048633 TaxID=3157095 RepID=UPI003402B704
MTRVRFPSIDARPTLRGILHFNADDTHADNSNCSRLTIAVPDHFVNRFSSNHTME